MKVFRGLPHAAARVPCALTIGNFDGVHRGHQALLAQLRQAANQRHLDAAVMIFEPHPQEFFAQRDNMPAKAPLRITELRDKLQLLARAHIDRVIVTRFNQGFATLAPRDFITQFLIQGLDMRWLSIGEDFCFGAQRSGNMDTLIAASQQDGFALDIIAKLTAGNMPISSSTIRTALANSHFAFAEQLLGHPYMISGHVVHGKKLGRTLGFPTLNINIAHRPPLSGIFVAQVHGLTAQPLPAVASIGVRPTVDHSGRLLLEAHLFDFNADCYGKLLSVEFLKKLRDEQKYDDLFTLKRAIAHDAHQARAWFQAHQHPSLSISLAPNSH